MVKDILTEALVGDLDKPQRVAVWRVILMILFILHIMWVAGMVPGYTDQGFVTASQFGTTKQTVKRIEQNQLEAKIEIAQERVCKATKEHNADALRYAVKQRNQFVQEYHRVTDEDYIVPTCKEIGYSIDE